MGRVVVCWDVRGTKTEQQRPARVSNGNLYAVYFWADL
jgi:hypothetical protein